MADSAEAKALLERHTAAGNAVRDLKKEGGDIGEALANLKAVKNEYKVPPSAANPSLPSSSQYYQW